MPHYSLMTIARPRAEAGSLLHALKSAAKTVLDKGGVVFRVENFGVRPLAYSITKRPVPGDPHHYVSGRFMNLHISAAPQVMLQVRDLLMDNPEVLRVMAVKDTRPDVHRRKVNKFAYREEYARQGMTRLNKEDMA